jgi:hypothetical protein
MSTREPTDEAGAHLEAGRIDDAERPIGQCSLQDLHLAPALERHQRERRLGGEGGEIGRRERGPGLEDEGGGEDAVQVDAVALGDLDKAFARRRR